MRRRGLFIAAAALAAAGCGKAGPRLVLIGDSTVADHPAASAPMAGWGQALRPRLQGQAEVLNLAVPGASVRRFLDRHWADARSRLQPGDHLLIQFGHVDALPDPARHSPPEGAYREGLLRFIGEARSLGARPVLVTPVSRYAFDAGRVVDVLGDYAQTMRGVATASGVPLIELGALSAAAMEQLGPAATRDWFMLAHDGRDIIHLTRRGAEAVAEIVASELRRLKMLRG